MRYKLKFIFLFLTIFYSTGFSQSQSKKLPIEVTCRKSFLGGSYVLQIKNTSTAPLNIWLTAREKYAEYTILPASIKDIGWVQGFRFDENDVFFIGSDGYDTLKQVMPSTGLHDIRIDFADNGALTVNLSQTELQKVANKYLKVPFKQSYPNFADFEITEVPQILLKNGSNKIYLNAVIHVVIFSGKVNIPVNIAGSFIPYYIPSTGAVMSSQLTLENINISNLSGEVFDKVKSIVNELVPIWFSNLQLYKVNNTILKYCKFFNVHKISVQNNRLVIELL